MSQNREEIAVERLMLTCTRLYEVQNKVTLLTIALLLMFYAWGITGIAAWYWYSEAKDLENEHTREIQ